MLFISYTVFLQSTRGKCYKNHKEDKVHLQYLLKKDPSICGPM